MQAASAEVDAIRRAARLTCRPRQASPCVRLTVANRFVLRADQLQLAGLQVGATWTVKPGRALVSAARPAASAASSRCRRTRQIASLTSHGDASLSVTGALVADQFGGDAAVKVSARARNC